MLSLPGYFEYIGQKTYIDKYPEEIITLEALKGKKLVEFGAGKGNDMRFLIEKVGLRPADVFYTEADSAVFDSVYEELEELFAPDPVENNHLDHIHLLDAALISLAYEKAQRSPLGRAIGVMDDFAPESFDYVYANNFLHCLAQPGRRELPFEVRHSGRQRELTGDLAKRCNIHVASPEQRVRRVFYEAYRLLRQKGVFFGRTQHAYIDEKMVIDLHEKSRRTENEEFKLRTAEALTEGKLFGMTEEQIVSYAAGSGFSGHKTKTDHGKNSPAGVIYFRFEK
ncbi:MAG: hypothetical protein HYX24_06855 [Candidatus Aenigmarchaeota archaeon]|nr:hypothetical protein [Candidatus Aenigmarchaeota archaeon]